MAYAYNSQAWLCCSNLDPSGSKTLSFTNTAARDSWIASMNPTVVTGCTYIQKDNTIVVGINADVLDAQGINYVCYTNPEVSGTRKFYAFVTNIEFKAMETSVLHLETDSFVTYQFDIDLSRSSCFIERQHVTDDNPDIHTLPEPIDPGELYGRDLYTFSGELTGALRSMYKNNYWIEILTSKSLTVTTQPDFLTGGPIPYYIYLVDLDDMKITLDKIIQHEGDIILGIYPIPKSFVGSDIKTDTYYGTDIYYPNEPSNRNFHVTVDFTKVGNHTVRNNKLNTYPFRYLLLTDRNTQSKILRYERLGTLGGQYLFSAELTYGFTPTMSVYPWYYNGGDGILSNGLTLNSFSQIPYTVNKYDEYRAINENSLKFNIFQNGINTAVSTGVNLVTGNYIGAFNAITGGIMNKYARDAELADKQSEPPSARNMASDNMLCNTGNLTIDLVDCCMDPEHAEIVDKYFDMFGYNVSIEGIPYWNTRPKYNFIKTIGCNMAGTIPMRDRAKINTLFDGGITVWHYGTGTYGVYSPDNK